MSDVPRRRVEFRRLAILMRDAEMVIHSRHAPVSHLYELMSEGDARGIPKRPVPGVKNGAGEACMHRSVRCQDLGSLPILVSDGEVTVVEDPHAPVA